MNLGRRNTYVQQTLFCTKISDIVAMHNKNFTPQDYSWKNTKQFEASLFCNFKFIV